MEEERNQRPEDASNLPAITLVVLVVTILALLYVGYGYFSDGPTVDTTAIVSENTNEAETNINPIIEEKSKPEKPAEKPNPKPEETTKESKKLVAEIPDGGQIIPHVVQSGETFFGIANRYNLKADVLRALNPDVDPTKIKVGATRLKVKINTKHTIGPGDILSVVAKKYDITKKALMDANKLEKDFAKRGDVLIIPLK